MRQGIRLDETSIHQYLSGIVADLQAVRLKQAEMKLSALAFERLTNSVPRGVQEPWIVFGRARAYETGEHVAACEHAIRRRKIDVALISAQRALARWTRPKGE